MNANIKWLDNPEIFRVNQLDAHSDHSYYVDYVHIAKLIGRVCEAKRPHSVSERPARALS